MKIDCIDYCVCDFRKRNDYADVDSSRSPVGLRRQRDISPSQSAMYDREIDKDR